MGFLVFQDFPAISSAFGKKVRKLCDRAWAPPLIQTQNSKLVRWKAFRFWERLAPGVIGISILSSRCNHAHLVRILACFPALDPGLGHQHIPTQHQRAGHEPGG